MCSSRKKRYILYLCCCSTGRFSRNFVKIPRFVSNKQVKKYYTRIDKLLGFVKFFHLIQVILPEILFTLSPFVIFLDEKQLKNGCALFKQKLEYFVKVVGLIQCEGFLQFCQKSDVTFCQNCRSGILGVF